VNGVTRLADIAPAGLLPSDAQRPRGVAAADAVRRAAPDVRVAPLRPAQATFAVLVGFAAPAALTALSHDARRLAHLAVAVRDGTVVVGPLVRPGQTPCLNCLDLHRLDRDPAWRVVAAQLHTGPEVVEPVAATTALTGAAYAAAEVLAHIDGRVPTTLGATVEITGPGESTRRCWTQHPRCGCRRRVRSRISEPHAKPT
jgi:bacteriocin biosynthesis cyclodehydratase domain-containing protein